MCLKYYCYGTHKTPVSEYEVLIIKKLLIKGREKNYSKQRSGLIYKIINIKFIFIINTFVSSLINCYAWILKILKCRLG